MFASTVSASPTNAARCAYSYRSRSAHTSARCGGMRVGSGPPGRPAVTSRSASTVALPTSSATPHSAAAARTQVTGSSTCASVPWKSNSTASVRRPVRVTDATIGGPGWLAGANGAEATGPAGCGAAAGAGLDAPAAGPVGGPTDGPTDGPTADQPSELGLGGSASSGTKAPYATVRPDRRDPPEPPRIVTKCAARHAPHPPRDWPAHASISLQYMSSPAERYAASRRRAQRAARYPALAEFAADLPFDLDPFQRQSCEALENGGGVLVCAPTGAGKTVVGEFAVHLALRTGAGQTRRKCFYTTPIKALSNQKFRDLVDRHGAANVGLLTGDNSINGDAPVVVMTTEVLRNMLYS